MLNTFNTLKVRFFNRNRDVNKPLTPYFNTLIVNLYFVSNHTGLQNFVKKSSLKLLNSSKVNIMS